MLCVPRASLATQLVPNRPEPSSRTSRNPASSAPSSGERWGSGRRRPPQASQRRCLGNDGMKGAPHTAQIAEAARCDFAIPQLYTQGAPGTEKLTEPGFGGASAP